MRKERKVIRLALLDRNEGQLGWLPKNPRQWTQTDIDNTAASIKRDTDFLEERPLLVVADGDRYCVFAGNLRREGCLAGGQTEAPCVEYFPVTEDDRETVCRRAMLDNGSFGRFDWDELANDPVWERLARPEYGIPVWQAEQQGDGEGKRKPTDGFDDVGDVRLADRFIVEPFSVIDTTRQEWQERKRLWLQKTGDLSETRDGEFGGTGNNGISGSIYNTINAGTSNFDPVLAEVIYTWFCPQGGSVLDPFGGEQTKGVVAGEMGLRYTAVEYRPEQVACNKEKTGRYEGVEYYCGDSNRISEIVKERGFALCFTSPPYYDLEVYSKEDMSALGTYEEFMAQYEKIFAQCYAMLDDDSFLVLKVGEIRDKSGVMRGFVSDNISTMQRIGFKYYNEIILVQAVGTAAIRANQSMKTRKVVKRHQNILVFVKGDAAKAVAKLPSLDYNDAEQRQVITDTGADITCAGGGELFGEMKMLYSAFSGEDIPVRCGAIPAGLEGFLKAAGGGLCVPAGTYKAETLTPSLDGRQVVLAFTGGKDSTASAIRLRDEGYRVTLLFIRNLNRSYPQEADGAKRIAAVLGLPLVTLEVNITGKNAHPDNPVKNQLILSLLADYAVANGIGKISMGVVPVADANYEYDWSDGAAQMQSYVTYLAERVQGLEYIYAGGAKEADNIAVIYNAPERYAIFPLLTSCVGTHRFRTNTRRSNEKKYGVKLGSNECGSCYKCAYSYITRAALGDDYAEDYLRKCFDIVKEKGTIYHAEPTADIRAFLRQHFGDALLDRVLKLYTEVV